MEGFLFAVGSQDPRKNFAGLVDAYRLLPQSLRTAYPLVIAGGDSTVFAEHSLTASPDVHHIGYVPDPALAALYPPRHRGDRPEPGRRASVSRSWRH